MAGVTSRPIIAALLLLAACGSGETQAPENTGSNNATHAAEGHVGPEAQEVKQVEDFASFWAAFRQAALAKDYGRVAQFVQFPLRAQRLLDDNPVVEIDAENFAAEFDRAMQSEVDLRGKRERQIDYIRSVETITVKEYDPQSSPDIAWVGYLKFERTNGKWRLVDIVEAGGSEEF